MIAAKLRTDLSGRDVRKALERAGFMFDRQRGSHMVLYQDNPHRIVVVPNHKNIRPGTLRNILRQAGLTVEELIEFL